MADWFPFSLPSLYRILYLYLLLGGFAVSPTRVGAQFAPNPLMLASTDSISPRVNDPPLCPGIQSYTHTLCWCENLQRVSGVSVGWGWVLCETHYDITGFYYSNFSLPVSVCKSLEKN